MYNFKKTIQEKNKNDKWLTVEIFNEIVDNEFKKEFLSLENLRYLRNLGGYETVTQIKNGVKNISTCSTKQKRNINVFTEIID